MKHAPSAARHRWRRCWRRTLHFLSRYQCIKRNRESARRQSGVMRTDSRAQLTVPSVLPTSWNTPRRPTPYARLDHIRRGRRGARGPSSRSARAPQRRSSSTGRARRKRRTSLPGRGARHSPLRQGALALATSDKGSIAPRSPPPLARSQANAPCMCACLLRTRAHALAAPFPWRTLPLHVCMLGAGLIPADQ